MTHCRSYERTYGLEALWRYEGTEHSKLPHRSGVFTGWSEAVINSKVLGIFFSSGKLLLTPLHSIGAARPLRALRCPTHPQLRPFPHTLPRTPISAQAGHPDLSYDIVVTVWQPSSGLVCWLDPLYRLQPQSFLVHHLLCLWLSEGPISIS